MEDQEDRNLGVDDLDTIWGHLPEEIVEDILVRLPVKTLLRFKPVSKSWYALISHPQFAKSHIDRANNNNKGHNFNLLRLEKYGLLCFEAKPNPSISLIITDHDDGDRIKLKKQLRNPFLKDQGGEAPGCNDEVQLLGSCDGLLFVCVAASDEIFLWNPSTGETKLISSISEFSSSFHFNFQRISGLGYDDGSNNYKAIIAFRTMSSLVIQPKFGVPEKIAVYVCNSKSGASSIKYYHDFPYSFYRTYIHLGGVTVNGTPHWVVPHIYEDYNHASPNKAIICFDMAEESFKEVSCPDSLTISSHFNVADLGGLLCVVDSVFNGLDVWAMKDYGVKESWTKLFAISTQNDYMNPLKFINIGEVLIHIGNNLVTCNLETGKEFISQRDGSKAVAYVESLVSPNGRGLDGRPC